jgi:hypothetical protein
LYRAHNLSIIGCHHHVIDAAAASVAKRKLAPAPSECWIVAKAIGDENRRESRKQSSGRGKRKIATGRRDVAGS